MWLRALLICLLASAAQGQVVLEAKFRKQCYGGQCVVQTGKGTAFGIARSSTHTLLATAAHNVYGASEVRIWDGERWVTCEYDGGNRNDDVAFISVRGGQSLNLWPIAAEPPRSRDVVLHGYNPDRGWAVVRQPMKVLDSPRVAGRRAVSSRSIPGQSGSPVVHRGRAVGIMVQTDAQYGYIVPWRNMVDQLRRAGYGSLLVEGYE